MTWRLRWPGEGEDDEPEREIVWVSMGGAFRPAHEDMSFSCGLGPPERNVHLEQRLRQMEAERTILAALEHGPLRRVELERGKSNLFALHNRLQSLIVQEKIVRDGSFYMLPGDRVPERTKSSNSPPPRQTKPPVRPSPQQEMEQKILTVLSDGALYLPDIERKTNLIGIRSCLQSMLKRGLVCYRDRRWALFGSTSRGPEQDAVLAALPLGIWMTVEKLSKATSLGDFEIRRALSALVNAGLVAQVRWSHWVRRQEE